MRLALWLKPYPDRTWILAKQIGVSDAVTKIPRFDKAASDMPPWGFMQLLHLKNRFEDFGLCLTVLEGDQIPMRRIKLGLPGRDEDIEQFQHLLRNMGKIGIRTLCYNFMAQFGWLRTSTTTRTRGGAITSSFDYELIQKGPLTEAGIIGQDAMWDNLTYFLKAVVPVAEEAGVKMALHPDDPPVPSIRGISRILSSVDLIKRALNVVASPNSGLTFCQANFSAMGEDIPNLINHFGQEGKIFFVHFRDVRGRALHFEETFIDDGQTDMASAMQCYYEVGFDGPMRPDHVPTMEGEENDMPGYKTLGRLFAIGYIKGLMDAVIR